LCFLLTLLVCLFKFVVSLRKSPLYNFDNFPNMLAPFSSCVHHDSIFFLVSPLALFVFLMFFHCFFLFMFF
jgi:hypothetical protein